MLLLCQYYYSFSFPGSLALITLLKAYYHWNYIAFWRAEFQQPTALNRMNAVMPIFSVGTLMPVKMRAIASTLQLLQCLKNEWAERSFTGKRYMKYGQSIRSYRARDTAERIQALMSNRVNPHSGWLGTLTFKNSAPP